MDWVKYFLLVWMYLILFVFQFTTGLKCYQCRWKDGMGDKGCQLSPPPSTYLKECNQPQCWKKYAYAKGKQFVERYCVAIANPKANCIASDFDDGLGGMYPATECTCNTQGCNEASRLQSLHYPLSSVIITCSLAMALPYVAQKFLLKLN